MAKSKAVDVEPPPEPPALIVLQLAEELERFAEQQKKIVERLEALGRRVAQLAGEEPTEPQARLH